MKCALVFSIVAFLSSILSGNLYAIFFGTPALILIQFIGYTQLSRCALITAGCFALVMTLISLLVNAALRSAAGLCKDAEDADTGYDDDIAKNLEDTCDEISMDLAFSFIATCSWTIAGLSAFLTPEFDASIRHQTTGPVSAPAEGYAYALIEDDHEPMVEEARAETLEASPVT